MKILLLFQHRLLTHNLTQSNAHLLPITTTERHIIYLKISPTQQLALEMSRIFFREYHNLLFSLMNSRSRSYCIHLTKILKTSPLCKLKNNLPAKIRTKTKSQTFQKHKNNSNLRNLHLWIFPGVTLRIQKGCYPHPCQSRNTFRTTHNSLILLEQH